MHFEVEQYQFALKEPFRIAGEVFFTSDTLRVTLEVDGTKGCGEAIGVYYIGETLESITDQAEQTLNDLGGQLGFSEIAEALPPGGARNAIDCALWDLKCKREGKRVWEYFGLTPRSLKTAATLGLDTPDNLARKAVNECRSDMIKLKLDSNDPVEKVEAVRKARPDARIIVDVNQGWSIEMLRDHAPSLARLGVEMIEQPLPRGCEHLLVDFRSPIALAADESCLHSEEITNCDGYDIINIKLDKTGGLSGAVDLVKAANRAGKAIMVGNMCGTSLSMAPSWVIAHWCEYIDLDGPLLIEKDVDQALKYARDGSISTPAEGLWG